MFFNLFTVDRIFLGALITRRKNSFFRDKFKKEFLLDSEQRDLIMKKRLKNLLDQIPHKVPYYYPFKTSLEEINIDNVEDSLKKLPIITKKELLENFEQFKNNDFINKLSYVKTNGSLGPSLFYCYDKRGVDISSAITHACQEIKFGKKVNYHEYISGEGNPTFRENIREMCKRWILKKTIQVLPIASKYDEFDDDLLPKANSKRYVLQGHASTIKLLAKYLSSNEKKFLSNCAAIETTGELLTKFDRNFIESELGVSIVDRYGLAEAGVVAYQLNKNTNFLKIIDTLFYVEVDQNKSIIVTSLTNYGMPLIRYDTGDKGEIITSADGSKYLYIFGGRKHDFITFDGLRISSSSIQDELSRISDVYEFQIIVDKRKDLLEIILDTSSENSFEQAKKLLTKFLPVKTIFKKNNFANFQKSGSADKFQRIFYLN